ncbi:hypothetical protein ABZ467_38740 [Streptomyces sp. NPDC005727]|uniref:hypothetical protein n=1 Tax=Streptomyces sp. NPDC005727 TaxID=3157053 RepID=UPI0033C3825E
MAIDDPHERTSPFDASRLHSRPAASIPLFAGDEVLVCGQLLSRAWEQSRDTEAADPHALSCPHCREAAEQLATVDAATRVLRVQETPRLHALTDRIMHIVRTEVRLGRLLPLANPDRGLQIAENVAAKVLRQAADAVPGTRAATCRLAPITEGTNVRVTMTVALTLDHPLPDRVLQVRRSVLHSAEQDLGLAVGAVDITVTDVLEPEPFLRHSPPDEPSA